MNISLKNQDERLGYFAWALEALPETNPFATLLTHPQPETHLDLPVIAEQIKRATSLELYPYDSHEKSANFPFRSDQRQVWPYFDELQIRYAGLIPDPSTVRHNVQAYFGADDVQDFPPPMENAAYRLMLSCFLQSQAGEQQALAWLQVLLLRGPINRQMAIARFLATVTRGKLGLQQPGIPSQEQVITWAGTNPYEVFLDSTTLSEMLGLYTRLAQT